MTRFEKWIAQQDEGKRAEMICSVSKCSDCPIKPACASVDSSVNGYRDEEWIKTCEAYLDEEVDDEKSHKRTD